MPAHRSPAANAIDDAFLVRAAMYIGGIDRARAEDFATAARSRGIPFERGPVGDSAAFRMARRHPSLLSPLDAGCALLRRDDALRRALLLVAAVMETDPSCAALFLPKSRGVASLALLVLAAGARAVLAALAGAALLAFLPRDGRRGAVAP